jgi:phosphate transport system substrate-binding protein
MSRKNHSCASVMLLILLFNMLLAGCGNRSKYVITDSPTSGSIHISVDESFKPVIEEQIKVFEATYPGTKIIASYKSEADCFRDLYSDSANRMVVVTRGLTASEAKFYNDSLGFSPVSDRIAADAITILLNSSNTDTLFTLDRLQKQLTGKMGTKQTIVFDGLNATSTVRFVIDSILKGTPFDTSVVKAVKNSQAVLDYVASSPGAIGLVGISWIGNPEDTAQVRMLKKVKFGYVQCGQCADSPYVKPTQAGIISRRYPLVRGLYYILKENFNGLGSGFTTFMKYERGQLIFRRAYLAPVMDFDIRTVKLNVKL